MVNKNRMSAIVLMLTVLSASAAECYVRTATVSASKAQSQRITDIRYTKLPYNGLRKCIAHLRIQTNNRWQNAEGEGVADTDEQACENARDILTIRYLQPIGTASVDSESSVVCTDAPAIAVREKVKIGDWVKESELAPLPQYPKPFLYNGTTCKWFSHRETHQNRPVGFAGVMCIMQPNQWQVVDLF